MHTNLHLEDFCCSKITVSRVNDFRDRFARVRRCFRGAKNERVLIRQTIAHFRHARIKHIGKGRDRQPLLARELAEAILGAVRNLYATLSVLEPPCKNLAEPLTVLPLESPIIDGKCALLRRTAKIGLSRQINSLNYLLALLHLRLRAQVIGDIADDLLAAIYLCNLYIHTFCDPFPTRLQDSCKVTLESGQGLLLNALHHLFAGGCR